MRKLIESTHVSLRGEVGSPQDLAFPYLNEEHNDYAMGSLFTADVLPFRGRHPRARCRTVSRHGAPHRVRWCSMRPWTTGHRLV